MTATNNTPTLTVDVQPTQTHQTIEGFGASGAWWAQAIGGWRDENRQRIIDLLFHPTKGIGLSLFRYNIGGGEQAMPDPWRSSETFATEHGYDWSRDRNARWAMHAACAAGVSEVVVFANSAPGHMTHSGRASGNPGGDSNLRPECYGDFARYLIDITRHLIEDEHLPVRWISPINEPQWDWQPSKGQEGCHYTHEEIVGVLLALQAAIDQSGLPVAISAVEAGEWQSASFYAQAIFSQPRLAQALKHFAVHSYWSNAQDKAAFADFMRQHYPHISLWMSEWTEMVGGRAYGMDSALTLANVIHDDVTLGGVTSWQYWIAVSKYDFRDGLLYVNESDEAIEVPKRLWAMGNYSRFVRPGATRIQLNCPSDAVRGSAFINAANGGLTLILINNSATAQTISLSNLNPRFRTLQQYETSAAHDLACVYDDDIRDQVTLTAESVTTLVVQ